LNVNPNVIYPIFEKFVNQEDAVIISHRDILVVKDGSPAVISSVTETFLEAYNEVAAGTHVYAVKLFEKYQPFSAFISCWLNSTYGQALLRRYIAGSVSPTLRREDLGHVIIPIPEDKDLAEECEKRLEDLQRQIIEGTDFTSPSEKILGMLGHVRSLPRLPTNWYSGVGRDPHGFHRQIQELENIGENVPKPDLPIWISDRSLDDRIDNNYFTPAYQIAIEWIQSLNLPIKTIGEMKETIFVGETPKDEGDIPVIEGRNMKPNCIFPNFQKFSSNQESLLQDYDLVVARTGTSGMVIIILPYFRQHYRDLTISDNVHALRLKNEFKQYSPFVCLYLNSKIGQSLLRRNIAGSVTPILSQRDLVNIPIPLPQNDDILRSSEELLTNLQDSFLQSSRFVRPSDKLLEIMGLTEPLPKLPVNWMPGGKRDPHGYYDK